MLPIVSGGTGAATLGRNSALVSDATGTKIASTPLWCNLGDIGAAATIDFTAGVIQRMRATDDVIFTLENAVVGVNYTLQIFQDDVGNHAYTFPNEVMWPEGVEPVGSGINYTDLIYLFFDGTNYLGRYTLKLV